MGSKPDSAGVSTVSGALFVHASINGRRCPCLVDTGSEVTIINESLVRSVKSKIRHALSRQPVAVLFVF